ncbi:flagellar hook-length control protein FliK [Cryobacterium breve]|uniref:Flagellar hook-length control protein FliK n=1 Tax=Cryobacterium breve TaxID=1259258 RepID=A0ABY7NEX5_9MICO|nr:flagellar hook-length control protein FliK [Cryobacterium breve]WBM80108.1 flagellar hook-length control protein FliK [Cryobacterium breve]
MTAEGVSATAAVAVAETTSPAGVPGNLATGSAAGPIAGTGTPGSDTPGASHGTTPGAGTDGTDTTSGQAVPTGTATGPATAAPGSGSSATGLMDLAGRAAVAATRAAGAPGDTNSGLPATAPLDSGAAAAVTTDSTSAGSDTHGADSRGSANASSDTSGSGNPGSGGSLGGVVADSGAAFGSAAATAAAATTGTASAATATIDPASAGAAFQTALHTVAASTAVTSASAAGASTATSGAAQLADLPLAGQVGRGLASLIGAANGEHAMTITVNPDNLGPVTVRAHIGGSSIRVELFAPTDLARDALRAILPELRRDLAQGGTDTRLDLSGNSQPDDSRAGGSGAFGAPGRQEDRTSADPGSARAPDQPGDARESGTTVRPTYRDEPLGYRPSVDVLA